MDSSSRPPTARHRPADVVVVEDDPVDREMVLRTIAATHPGLATAAAESGEAAIAMLTGPDRLRPGLVLLDLKLPRIDGVEVLERLRATTATRLVPVVMLTSSRDPRDVVRAYSAGANGYLVKPVGLRELAGLLACAIGFWCGANTPPSGFSGGGAPTG
ncbi:MAG: response regulator [Thermoleophilia bacterium]|jgi:CheY-like chemotaxis protein|nr:response regulator [Thermoleophilia bacterium]